MGDYSRICVKKDEKEHYFLPDFSTQEDLNYGDILIIHWATVDNHAIEDPEHIYSDIAIKELRKINLP